MLTSCGEDEASAAELIRQSPAAMADAGTARMEMSMAFGPVDIQAEGAFDLENQTGTMSMEMPAPLNATLDMVFDDTTYFMSTDAFGGAIPGVDAEWIRYDLDDLAQLSGIDLDQLSQGGATSDPTNMLDALEGVSADGIEDLGTEEVRGVSAHHYAAEIDMQAALDQAEDQVGELLDDDAAERFLEAYGDDPVPVEVWIDDDGLTRKMTMDVSVQGQDGSFTLEMFDYGEPVDIQIPSEDDSVDFAELLGSLGGD
jgi:hypothetical protein